MEDSPLEPHEKKPEQGFGAIAATVIIVIIVVIGGVYFLVQQEQHIRALKIQQQQAQLPANS